MQFPFLTVSREALLSL